MNRNDVVCRRINCVVSLIVVSIFCASTFGCKGPKTTTNSVDQKLVGSWVLAREQTIDKQIKAIEDAGLLAAAGGVQELKRNFASSFFTIELLETGEFTSSMGSAVEQGVFSGNWETSGDKISLAQTHEGSEEKEDRISGHVVGDQLSLVHVVQGVSLPYVFKRSPQTTEADQEPKNTTD